jgi:tetratricopeptide (TPR) repeat protein
LSIKCADALDNKGLALVRMGKYEEAITYFNKVLEIDENDSIALHYKELVYTELKKEKN